MEVYCVSYHLLKRGWIQDECFMDIKLFDNLESACKCANNFADVIRSKGYKFFCSYNTEISQDGFNELKSNWYMSSNNDYITINVEEKFINECNCELNDLIYPYTD